MGFAIFALLVPAVLTTSASEFPSLLSDLGLDDCVDFLDADYEVIKKDG